LFELKKGDLAFFFPLKEGLRVLLGFSLKAMKGVSNLGTAVNPYSTESSNSHKSFELLKSFRERIVYNCVKFFWTYGPSLFSKNQPNVFDLSAS
jgi:hypothetical protein